jgi:6-phosphogluconolactonase
MKIDICPDAESAAAAAAAFIAAEARAAAAARGRFVLAVSGGRTPALMLRDLAGEEVPWRSVQVVQVDERLAPEGHPARNLNLLREGLLAHGPLRPEQVHAMPVELADPEEAARRYARTLEEVAGSPPTLDLAHLGLGADGHTASLVPGDAALEVTAADVALSGAYQGWRRMTLTYPVLARARRILWLVTGAEKAEALERLYARDRSIPAGRVPGDHAQVIADRAAAAGLPSSGGT